MKAFVAKIRTTDVIKEILLHKKARTKVAHKMRLLSKTIVLSYLRVPVGHLITKWTKSHAPPPRCKVRSKMCISLFASKIPRKVAILPQASLHEGVADWMSPDSLTLSKKLDSDTRLRDVRVTLQSPTRMLLSDLEATIPQVARSHIQLKFGRTRSLKGQCWRIIMKMWLSKMVNWKLLFRKDEKRKKESQVAIQTIIWAQPLMIRLWYHHDSQDSLNRQVWGHNSATTRANPSKNLKLIKAL